MAEPLGRGVDGRGGADALERRRRGHRFGRDTGDPLLVAVTADDAEDRRAVVAPCDVLDRVADDNAGELLRQVLVAQLPGSFDIDDGDVLSRAAWPLPRPVRVHAFGRGCQVALAPGEVGCRGCAFLEPLGLFGLGFRRGAVGCGPSGYGAGLEVRRLDLGEGRQPGGELLGPVPAAPYTVEEREVRQRAPAAAGRSLRLRRQSGPGPFLTAEHRFQRELFVAQEHVQCGDVRPGGRPYALSVGAQPGLGPCDDDQLRLGSLIGESSSVGSRARSSRALTWEFLIGHRYDRSLRVPCSLSFVDCASAVLVCARSAWWPPCSLRHSPSTLLTRNTF